jgi:hypothetical protein
MLGVLAIASLVIKPWQAGDVGGGAGTGSGAGAASSAGAGSSPGAVAVATAGPTPTSIRPADCPFPSGWQIHASGPGTDRWHDSWWALEPVAANGPYDDTIPVVVVVTSSVARLGYCAPLGGEMSPPGPLTATVWQLIPLANARAGLPILRQLELTAPSETSFNDHATGDLFAPPFEALDFGGTWYPTTYVFRLQSADHGWTRWFATTLRLVRPSPSPPAAPPTP